MLKEVIQTVLVLLVGALVSTLLGLAGLWVHKMFELWKTKVDNEVLKSLIDKLDYIVQKCIEATNQTFVNDIKSGGKLTEEQKKEAFNKTFEDIMNMLSEEDKQKIAEQFGDIPTYITNSIESYIGNSKDV